MGFFDRFKNTEKRSGGLTDVAFWKRFDAFVNQETNAGEVVNDETALSHAAVFACIRVIAETCASLPLHIYKRLPDGGKEEATDHPLYRLLRYAPNHYQTSFEWREQLIGHVNLRGNAYSFIRRTEGGNFLSFIPLDPTRITIEINPDRSFRYMYKVGEGIPDVAIAPEDIWHLKFFSRDGYTGLSPITLAREAIGMSIAAEKMGASQFTQKPVMSGILKTPRVLTESGRKNIRESLNAFKNERKNDILILEESLDWSQVGVSNEDLQYLQTRLFQVEEIARVFRVPAILIGHPDKTATYASAEQFFLSFAKHTIIPWLTRIEQSLMKALLPEDEIEDYVIEHKIETLLRGDIKTRYEAYSIGKSGKWLTTNEIRAMENMNPVEGGDTLENPNITPKEIGDIGADPEDDAPGKVLQLEIDENGKAETGK